MKRFVPPEYCREAYMVLKQHSPKYAKLFRETRIVIDQFDISYGAWYEDRQVIKLGPKFALAEPIEQASILVHELTHKLQHGTAADYNAVDHEIEAFEKAVKFYKRVNGNSTGVEGGPVANIIGYYDQGKAVFEAKIHEVYDRRYAPFRVTIMPSLPYYGGSSNYDGIFRIYQ